jgi:hypothetical protein
MFATTREEVSSFVRSNNEASKVMITIFFTGTRLLVLNFNQQYFIERVLPSFSKRKLLNRRKNVPLDFVIHMDHSVCHNATRITEKLRQE